MPKELPPIPLGDQMLWTQLYGAVLAGLCANPELRPPAPEILVEYAGAMTDAAVAYYRKRIRTK